MMIIYIAKCLTGIECLAKTREKSNDIIEFTMEDLFFLQLAIITRKSYFISSFSSRC